MSIEIDADKRQALIDSIRRYAAENLDEEMGDLKAGLFLDFCLEEIGPSVYNKAIADARSFILDRVSDMENTCYEHELPFWEKK